MAHIRKTNTGRYQVRYRDPSAHERARHFDRKIDAQRFASTVEADMVRGEWTDPRLGRITFAEWSGHVQASRGSRRGSTIARDESVLANHVLPTFGVLSLSAIQPSTIRSGSPASRTLGYAPATIRKAYHLLASALNLAVSDSLIPRSPAVGASLPKVEHHEMRFLDADEIEALADAIDPRYRTLILAAAYTGLRFGELAALETRHLDMLRRTLRVDQTLTEVRGKLSVGPAKTAAARRTVALPRFLVEEIAAHLAVYPPRPYVFSAEGGAPLRRTNFRRRKLAPAVSESVGEPMRFHDLRHTHAALLIEAGEHPKVIQSRLGHASIRTTLDTYGHLFDGLDEAAADRLDKAFRGPRADSSRTLADTREIHR